MTIIRNQNQQIYNALTILLTFVLLMCALNSFTSRAYAQSEEHNLNVDYSKFNADTSKVSADKSFEMAINSKSEEEKKEYLKKSAAQYYILSNINKSDVYAYIQLARIYDMQRNDSYAKSYFYRALGISPKNIDANYYFGNFYYTRNQYKRALDFYQKAIQYGKTDDALVYKNIGHIYERFGDLPRAITYYKKSLELNSGDSELSAKIDESVKNEYEKSGYYKRRIRY